MAAKVFLKRSRELPLNVDLPLGPGDEAEIDILNALVPHTHRF